MEPNELTTANPDRLEELQVRVEQLEKKLRDANDTVREIHKGHVLLLSALLHDLLAKKVDHSTLIRLASLVQAKGLAALGFSVQENPIEETDDRPNAMERYATEGIVVWDGKTSVGR